MGAERNGTDATRGHTWTCGAGRTWVVYRRVGEAMVYHCRLPAGPSTAYGGCVMNGPVVRRRVTFSTGQVGRPRPPHPIDASYRIVSVAYWTRTSHRPGPHTCAPVTSAAASSPAAPRPRRSPPRAHTGRSTLNVLIKSGPPDRRTPFTAPIRSRPAGGRRGAPCGKNTRTRDTGLYMRPAGDCRPLQDACIGTKAQPDADPRAAATKTTPMMKTCTSRAHLTSEELTAQHRIALKASAAERRGFTRRRLLGRLLCR